MKKFNPDNIFSFLSVPFIILSLCTCQNESGVKDINGEVFKPDTGISAFVFLDAECPVCRRYQGNFKSEDYPMDKLFFVFPGIQKRKDILDFIEEDAPELSHVLVDKDLELVRRYKATVTPEVVIVCNEEIRYHGLIDNRFTGLGTTDRDASVNYLRNALNSLQNHESIQIESTEPVGCFIELP